MKRKTNELRDASYVLLAFGVLAGLSFLGVYLMIQGGGWMVLGFPMTFLSVGLLLKIFQGKG